MKFLRHLSFILLLVSFSTTAKSYSNGHFSYHSYALQEVLDAIYDASFDFDGVYVITHNLDFQSAVKGECSIVSAQQLLNHFAQIFDEFRSFYPDEELPYDEALVDLRRLTKGTEYEKCVESYIEDYMLVTLTQYNAVVSDLWIKIEYSILK